jgi:hypothetical protein
MDDGWRIPETNQQEQHEFLIFLRFGLPLRPPRNQLCQSWLWFAGRDLLHGASLSPNGCRLNRQVQKTLILLAEHYHLLDGKSIHCYANGPC